LTDKYHRHKSACAKFQEQKSAGNKFRKKNQLHEEKNQDEISFYNKDYYVTRSTNKNYIATISMRKISLTVEKSMYKFHDEKNQHARSFLNLNQQVKFHKQKKSEHNKYHKKINF